MNHKETRDVLEGWGRWRHYRFGGYGKTLTQKFIEGIPGTNCPACSGRGKAPVGWRNGKQMYIVCPDCGGSGRVDLEPKAARPVTVPCPAGCKRGEVDGKTCHKCRGNGIKTVLEDKINPAFIRATYIDLGNPLYERVDRLVCELRQRPQTLGYFFVLYAEYCDTRGGTQAIRAQRMHLTTGCYESRLWRAIEWVGAALHDNRTCDVIPFPYEAA